MYIFTDLYTYMYIYIYRPIYIHVYIYMPTAHGGRAGDWRRLEETSHGVDCAWSRRNGGEKNKQN